MTAPELPGLDRARAKYAEERRKRLDANRGAILDRHQFQASAAALKPYYRYQCKRPAFHDQFLPAFNRPNVRLVDTNGRGVDRITERGVVVDGAEYELSGLRLTPAPARLPAAPQQVERGVRRPPWRSPAASAPARRRPPP
jgi:cation diffusion facilitator CzcD-associated flavoprotein CzcO